MPTYYWKCPKCNTTLQLRQRITLNKRNCPQCGNSITAGDIDRETARHQPINDQKAADRARSEQVRKTLKEISDRLNFGK